MQRNNAVFILGTIPTDIILNSIEFNYFIVNKPPLHQHCIFFFRKWTGLIVTLCRKLIYFINRKDSNKKTSPQSSLTITFINKTVIGYSEKNNNRQVVSYYSIRVN